MSGTVAVKAKLVACNIKITSLLYAGKARRKAEGKIIRRYRLDPASPRERAASTSPRGVAFTAPVSNSVVYAHVFTVKAGMVQFRASLKKAPRPGVFLTKSSP